MQQESIPLIKVHGAPYRRGLQHGRACGDLIRRYPDVLGEVLRAEAQWRALDVTRPLPGREELFARAMRFLPALEAFAPHLVEELRGIADGARLPFAEVLLVNVRAEVMGLTTADAACTAFAAGRTATAEGRVMSGQTLDQHPLNRELLIVLHVEPDQGPAALMCSFAGLIGYPGINAAGVSFFQNALSTPVWCASAMPHYLMKRVLLEQATLAGCLSAARRAPVCSSTNYVVTDGTGKLADFEVTPDGTEVLEAERDILVHTNHFLSAKLLPQEALLPNIPDSAKRAPRMQELLFARHGRLTIDDLKNALSDHDGAPVSICRHEPANQTIAAIIAEPEDGRLHVAGGHPCSSSFSVYSL
ncbi:MAG: C45 family autoproteolytic acyltransferase/hydrolase [Aestuariivirga sp.]